MAVYAAVVPVKRSLSFLIQYTDFHHEPYVLNKLKSMIKELESFQHLLDSLDRTDRARMSTSLGRAAEAVRMLHRQQLDPDILIEVLKLVREEYQETSHAVSCSKARVGLFDVWTKLKEDVLVPRARPGVFYTLSLVGMPGVGKTALARDIFEDLDVAEWFECRAWVSVGVEFKPREITRAILAQVDSGNHDGEMAMSLKESLKGKRFLVVFDGVWNEDIHDYLESSFPDSESGSQILLTTRNVCVARGRLEVRLLNKEESWQLLRDRVFAGAGCPARLEEDGKKIAKKCEGLPLTIVTVADLLSKAHDQESLWIEVANKKKHNLFIEAYDQISEVLYPSYMELGQVFKACFVYMGLFPLKCVIRGSKLIQLWIAEDVITQEIIGKSLEFHGIVTLDAFCKRGLVMVHKRSTGLIPSTKTLRIKTCRLHSSWWYFCQREASKKNYFHVLDCFDDAFEEGIQSKRWLSIHNNVLFALKDVHESIEENCASTALTLLCFGPYCQYMVPLCFGLKLLQRLDALNIRFYDFPLEVVELVELRYLALTCNGEIPSCVSNLGKLQYLIVDRHSRLIKSYGAPSYLPPEIWEMKNLKHLRVMGSDLPDTGNASLPELTTLLDVSTRSCIVLRRVSNLKKLGIRIELTPDAKDLKPLCGFDHLSHLETLKCVVVNPECKFRVPSFSCLPFSLKKLSLSGLGYPWNEMSKIASLPNLETLKLRYNAFQGPEWEVEENGFQKLYLIQMEDIDVVRLKWARGSFRCLNVLKMKHCYKLQELDMDEHGSIKEFEVVDCNPLSVKSLKQNLRGKGGLRPRTFEVHSSWESK